MRGCLLVASCGCSTLDGRVNSRCAAHTESGEVAVLVARRLVPEPTLDGWLEQQVAAGRPGAVERLLERRG